MFDRIREASADLSTPSVGQDDKSMGGGAEVKGIQEIDYKGELTEEEKSQVDAHLETIELTTFSVDDEKIKRHCDEEQAILGMGRKVLPYLWTVLQEGDAYMFSRYASELSTEEDIALLLECIESPDALWVNDFSAISNLEETLFRHIYNIRKANTSNPELVVF
jgi:hypothetical protein